MCPTASFLATGGFKFNYFQMHAWSTSMLLLLHSAFMLSVVKMLLKGEVGGHALKVMEITLLIMEYHVKAWNCVFEFFVGTLL